MLSAVPLFLILVAPISRTFALAEASFRGANLALRAQEDTACPAFWNDDLGKLRERALLGPVYAQNVPQESLGDSHDYLFLVGLPFTGTTALLSLLSTSPEVGNLCGNEISSITCEGTFFLSDRGLIPNWDLRWDAKYPADWNAALAIYDRVWNVSKRVLVDKSPPNSVKMLRISQDLARTNKNAYFIVLSRSPCYVNKTERRTREPSNALARATEMIKGFEQLPPSRVLHIQYEEMIRNPYKTADKILEFMPQLGQLDPTVNGLNAARNDNKVKHIEEKVKNSPKHAGKDQSLVGFIESRYPFDWPPVTLKPAWLDFMRTFGY